MERRCANIRSALQSIECESERESGVPFNEAMILCALRRNGRMSSGKIGELLGQTRSNTSKIVAGVERKGFIERRIGSDDKHRMYFALTASGHRTGYIAVRACETLAERVDALPIGKNAGTQIINDPAQTLFI